MKNNNKLQQQQQQHKKSSVALSKKKNNNSSSLVRSKSSYVTLRDDIDGCDFRKMAKIMTEVCGYKMNHATARNQLILAVESFLLQTTNRLKLNVGIKEIRKMANRQDIQDNLADVLFMAYEELKREEKEKEKEEEKKI